jgi:hypothetical protein
MQTKRSQQLYNSLCQHGCSREGGEFSSSVWFYHSKRPTVRAQIRINFYCTMFLLALVPQTPHTEELLNALYANAGIAGLGLLLTAIIQTVQRQLSLFHAVFTLHILYFLGTGASPMGECPVAPRSSAPTRTQTPHVCR